MSTANPTTCEQCNRPLDEGDHGLYCNKCEKKGVPGLSVSYLDDFDFTETVHDGDSKKFSLVRLNEPQINALILLLSREIAEMAKISVTSSSVLWEYREILKALYQHDPKNKSLDKSGDMS